MANGIGHLYADNGDTSIPKGPGVGVVHIDNMPEGGGEAPVTSVNGKTGAVSLDASDVGALPADTPIPAAQVNSDWNAESGAAQILNKPSIPSTLGDIQTTAGITDIQRVTALPANPVSTVLYIVVGS